MSTAGIGNIDSLAQQLIELQTQFAFQEDVIAALNRVVTSQQHEIDHLRQLCEQLCDQGDELRARLDGGQEVAPPPHY